MRLEKSMKEMKRYFFLTLLLTGYGTVSSLHNVNDIKQIKQHDYHNAVTKKILDNGMTVLMYKNTSMPKVLVQVAYNIGSYIESAGERGLAHLLEHMIFKGTEKLSERDIDSIGRKYGATFNAFTSHDTTSYFFETDKNNWKPFVGILADCMQNARFDQQHLSSELWAVIQELKMNKDDHWRMMVGKVISSIFPAHHPYHAPIIGYKEDLIDITADKLKIFYDKYYQPSRALLIVAGDIDQVEVLNEVKQQFGSIKNKKVEQNVTFPQVNQDLMTQETRCYEDVQSAQMILYWRIPGLKDADEILSTSASFLLGSGENSPLYKALVDTQQIAASVGAFPIKLREDGVLLIVLEPLEGKAEACKQVVREVLLESIKQGFSDHEFKHMINSQKKASFKKLESLQGFAMEWLTSFFATGDEYAVFSKVDQFNAVTSQQVQAFMAQYLDPFMMNVIEVLPMPESKKEYAIQAKAASDAMDQKILTARPRTTPLEPPRYVHTMGDPQPLVFSFPKPQRTFTLSNGLSVILYADRALPIMSLSCRFRNAAYHTKVKEKVVLDLMMGMLIEGSKGYSKEDNVSFFDGYGADYSFTDAGAELSLLSDNYAEVVKRFLYTLQNPTFPADALEKTRDIVLDGLKRSKDDQQFIAFRKLANLLYKGHPYDWSIDESIALATEATVDQISAAHHTFVNPNNMILSIAGDFDLDDMEQTLRTIFASWPSGDIVPAHYTKAAYQPQPAIKVPMLRDQVVVLLAQPSPLDIYHDDIVPVRLLNYIAFKSLGSRIFALREQSGLFYTASGSWAEGATRDTGFDYLFTILTPDNVDSVDTKFRELVNRLGTDGVTAQELAAAQQMYLKSLLDLITTNRAKSTLFVTLCDLDLPFDRYDTILQRVKAISLDDLNRVAKKYFNADKMTSIYVGRV